MSHAAQRQNQGGVIAPSLIPVVEKEMNRQILVVDDDEWIRKLLLDIFEEKGFRVIEAKDGESACLILARHNRDIDLVTLDMEMPGIDGVETFNRLRSIHPELKVVILSGSPKYQDFKPPRVPRIDKPFTPDQLLGCVLNMVG